MSEEKVGEDRPGDEQSRDGVEKLDLPEGTPVVEFKDVTITFDVKALPARWRQTRAESLHRFGDEWIRDGRSATLLVPSAAIRGEWNVLLNPAHTEFSKIEFQDPEPFEFDARMFR